MIITTAEELDALPSGSLSVIFSETGGILAAATKVKSGDWFAIGWTSPLTSADLIGWLPMTVLYRPDQPTEPAIADDFAEHYGHLPVMLAETAQILASYLTGDERGWDAEEADLDLSETIASVQQYGIVNPITLGTDGRVLDGHHRLLSARKLGIGQVPVRLAIMPPEPARCAPSREDVRAAILSAWRAGGLNGPWAWPAADAVQALYASQRTEAEVKAEALREHRRRVVRFMPTGLVNRATVLADLDDYADRLAPPQRVPEVGLPTAEVPSVGGERHG